MEIALFLVVAVVALGVIATSTLNQHRRLRSIFDIAGGDLGLQAGALGLQGTFEGCEVKVVRSGGRRQGENAATVTVTIEPPLPPGFKLSRESFWKGADLETSSDGFDNSVHIDGPEVPVIAMLGHAQRKGVLRFLARRNASVDGSRLTCEITDIQAASVVHAVRAAVSLGSELSRRASSPGPALAENVREDPSHSVRLRSAILILQRLPSALPSEEVADFILGVRGQEELVARALGWTPDPRALPRLLELIDRADDAVAVVAIESLGRRGDARCRPRLLAIAEDPARSRAARKAAQAASDTIRERLGDPGQGGGLSVIGGEPGALSTAAEPPTPKGALSRSDD